MRAVTQLHIDEQLRATVIDPANSEWAIPAVFSPKKDGKPKFCVDYRRLDLVTIADTYYLSRLYEYIDSLGVAEVFTTLVANVGFWQIPFVKQTVIRPAPLPTVARTDTVE